MSSNAIRSQSQGATIRQTETQLDDTMQGIMGTVRVITSSGLAQYQKS